MLSCGTHKDTAHCIGAGLPSISPRLVIRTEVGEFIEMAKWLSKCHEIRKACVDKNNFVLGNNGGCTPSILGSK